MMTSSCSSTPASSGDSHQHQQQRSIWRCSAILALFLTAFLLAALPYWSQISSRGGNESSDVPSTAFRLSKRHNPAPKPLRRRRRHGRLILHVGPSKTATTSLQTDLTALQPALHRDGYAYAGRYYAPFVHPQTREFKLGRSESPLLVTAHNMLKKCSFRGDDRRKCCRDFVRELNAYAQQRSVDNVILSEEPFGNQWRTAEDWRAIQQALAENSSSSSNGSGNSNNFTTTIEWEMTVVIGYRHFYAWLPSARFQHERIDRINPIWPAGGGRAVHPFYPDWYDGSSGGSSSTTASSVPNWNKNFQHTSGILDAIGNDAFAGKQHSKVRLLNLHNAERRSPLRLLLCDILDTPAACRATLQREAENAHGGGPTVLNKASASAVPSAFYDAIATAAAATNRLRKNATMDGIRLINTTAHTRTVVRDAVRERHETLLGLGPYDLPLTCPPDDVLDQLWQTSLALEQQCTPDFADQQHRAGFEKYVALHKYCFVDTDAVLRDPEWRAFLQERFGM